MDPVEPMNLAKVVFTSWSDWGNQREFVANTHLKPDRVRDYSRRG